MRKPTNKQVERLDALVTYDRQLFGFGISLAGIDEVGRGPLAGNVVAACVILPESPLVLVDDSKKLSAKRREVAFEEIMKIALFVGIGEATPEEIDTMNIKNATKCAMARAGKNAPATLCVVDAEKNLDLPYPQLSIIKGDATSYHVAAASIVAKVTRDAQMVELSKIYPGYGFETNMGYGTKAHVEALCKLGATPIHRKTFITKWSGEA